MLIKETICKNCTQSFLANPCLCSCSFCHEQFCIECLPNPFDQKVSSHKGKCEAKCYICHTPSVGVCQECRSKCYYCRKETVSRDWACEKCLEPDYKIGETNLDDFMKLPIGYKKLTKSDNGSIVEITRNNVCYVGRDKLFEIKTAYHFNSDGLLVKILEEILSERPHPGGVVLPYPRNRLFPGV